MQPRGSGVAKTAYQRWVESGQPRPYLNEVIAVERFDAFALASLLLAVALLGWWFYSIYKVAFPEPKKALVTYSRQSGYASLFAPTSTPTLAPTPTPQHPLPWGGPRAGGTLPGGTRLGGTQVGGLYLMAVGAILAVLGFSVGYLISTRYRVVGIRVGVQEVSGENRAVQA
jgi:hypothetical protein